MKRLVSIILAMSALLFFTGACDLLPDNMQDQVSPVLTKAEIRSGMPQQVYLVFDKEMSGNIPASPAGFSVSINGTITATINGITKADLTTYIINIAETIDATNVVTVSYAGSPVVSSTGGGILGTFTDVAVVNNLSEPLTVALDSAEIRNGQPQKIYLSFDKEMSSSIPASPAGFSVLINGSVAATITGIVREDLTNYVVTISETLVNTDTVSVSYSGTPIVSGADNSELNIFSGHAVINQLSASIPPSLLLWNKLDSTTALGTSETGVNATYSGALRFTNSVHGAGLALAVGTDQVKFNNPFGTTFPDTGTIEFWWQPAHDENSSTGSHYAERFPFILTSDALSSTWPLFQFRMMYRGQGAPEITDTTALQVVNYGSGSGTMSYDLNFSANDVLHIAISWDKANPSSPLVLHVNGVIQTAIFTNFVGSAVESLQSNIAAGGSYDLELHRFSKRLDGAGQQFDADQVIDNLKIWNYAKTDFSDRNTE